MSLTITRKPIGHKLNTTDIDAQIIDDGQDNALVYTTSAHGLSDGDYVYIESDLEAYNGFKYVDSIQYDSFKIKESENGDYVPYEQDADISYRTSVLNHGWQCVHLPIVYELESDLWPNNVAEEAYTPNVIDSFQNSNGYVQLNLDRAITGVTALNYVELVGDGDLSGPYQIIEVVHPWAIVINLAYDSTYVFSGYQVVNYYNNYCANVEVWAGLSTPNRWYEKKPFELAATLKFIPDSTGKCLFSVHEILKGYIETRNNLLLNTLPNNLDFHVGFYIKYYESYDLSDGDTISTETGDVTTDSFIGRAVNAMLPFKTLSSGHLSDYVNEDTYLARWLTLFDRPMAVVDRFFDISFLNQYDQFDILILRNGELFQTITNPGSGVIRVMFIPESGFTEYCLQAIIDGDISFAMPTPYNIETGDGLEWVSQSVTIPGAVAGSFESDILAWDVQLITGVVYTFQLSLTHSEVCQFKFVAMDVGNNIMYEETINALTPPNQNASIDFTAETGMVKVGIYALYASAGGEPDLTVSVVSISGSGTADDITITERICIDIIEECSGTFVNDGLRITEGNQYRELE